MYRYLEAEPILQQIHSILYDAIQEVGVMTGDRLSGIKDGIRYKEGWLVKFDAATPALRCGLPLTLAINRVVLQDILDGGMSAIVDGAFGDIQQQIDNAGSALGVQSA